MKNYMKQLKEDTLEVAEKLKSVGRKRWVKYGTIFIIAVSVNGCKNYLHSEEIDKERVDYNVLVKKYNTLFDKYEELEKKHHDLIREHDELKGGSGEAEEEPEEIADKPEEESTYSEEEAHDPEEELRAEQLQERKNSRAEVTGKMSPEMQRTFESLDAPKHEVFATQELADKIQVGKYYHDYEDTLPLPFPDSRTPLGGGKMVVKFFNGYDRMELTLDMENKIIDKKFLKGANK